MATNDVPITEEVKAYLDIAQLGLRLLEQFLDDCHGVRGQIADEDVENVAVMALAHIAMEAFDKVYRERVDIHADDLKSQMVIAARQWLFLHREIARTNNGVHQ